MSKLLLIFLASFLCSAHAFAQGTSNDLSEGVFVEDDDAADKILSGEKKDEAAQNKPESDLKPETDIKKEEEPAQAVKAPEEKPPEEKIEDITKDIVEEPESKPPAEYPYPGATEEGYGPATEIGAQETPIRITQPIKKSAEGEYFYGFKSSDKDSAASIRFGFFTPPGIVNPANNKTWEDIYTNADIPTLFVDYEWLATKAFGEFGLKVASGLFLGNGTGQFVNDNNDRLNREAFEHYSFIMFPNLVSLIYRFQYSDTQPIVPFVEGGGGYFTFAEIRDDGANPKFGGAPVGMAAGGVAFLMDWLDMSSIRELDNDWGVNHVWLVAEYRLIEGLNKKYDFTSGIINAGIKMEF